MQLFHDRVTSRVDSLGDCWGGGQIRGNFQGKEGSLERFKEEGPGRKNGK